MVGSVQLAEVLLERQMTNERKAKGRAVWDFRPLCPGEVGGMGVLFVGYV